MVSFIPRGSVLVYKPVVLVGSKPVGRKVSSSKVGPEKEGYTGIHIDWITQVLTSKF